MADGFNLNNFMAKFDGGARQYLFYVILKNPVASMSSDDIKYLVRTSSIPESTIDPIELDWQGNKYKMGTTHTFNDWTVTFNVDKNATLRKDFEAWQNIIHDPITNQHGDPSIYMTEQEIWLLNGSGESVWKKKLVGAWPQTIGEISLDYSAKEVAQFDVTFSYQYFINA